MIQSVDLIQPPILPIKVGILGATGTVGQRLLLLLEKHPWFQIYALCASFQKIGKIYASAVTWRLSQPMPKVCESIPLESCENLTPESRLLACQCIFSALDATIATKIEANLAGIGIPVFSNAKSYRMNPFVPMIVPTANPLHLKPMIILQQQNNSLWSNTSASKPGYIVTNSNCSTSGLTIVLRALIDQYGPLAKVHVTTLQAISGAGYPGISSLDILDNVVPYIDGEEEKLATEPLKILGTWNSMTRELDWIPSMHISAACHRVPVLDGHLLSISVQFTSEVPSLDDVRRTLSDYETQAPDLLRVCPTSPIRPITVFMEQDRPQPRLDRHLDKGMTVCVGRIRKCSILDCKMNLLIHNTILGAAGASVLTAELAAVQGLL